ncbi:MAG: cellulase family glycosylhydrolase [Bryobacterales bacterium]|nr:cellulase family glycosylhydrolase [Bryobacterales bacterium]
MAAGPLQHVGCLLLAATTWACGGGPVPDEPAWGVRGRHLTLDGKPVFLSGVNYVPSRGWLTHLDAWDADAVDRDFEALQRVGVKAIRYLPLWHQLQPTPQRADPTALARLDKVIELAERHGLFVQLGILNSWMSGGTFLPSWANGNLFKDPAIVAGELSLVRDIAQRYAGRRILQGYDIGNELNVLEGRMNLDLDSSAVEEWQAQIVDSIRRHAPRSLIVNGVGTGYTESFNINSIAQSTDYMAAHSYPYFHGTSRLDPWLGQRTTYSTNYIISWAEMTGKPVLMQELGASQQWVHPGNVPKYLRLTFLSNWLEGAAGYLWWCSHDIDPSFAVPDEGLYKEYSTARVQQENKFSELNYDMGILDYDNLPKPAAEAFEHATGIVEELGVDWTNRLPVCYVLAPEGFDYESTMIQLITPFVLAKQVHMDVKLLIEGAAVPHDAAALVIAGFRLSPDGRGQVERYLSAGGTVYQSYFADFGDSLTVADEEIALDHPRLVVTRRAGAMELEQQLVVGARLRVRAVSASGNTETILSMPKQGQVRLERKEPDTSPFGARDGQGVLFRTRHGSGVYYYLAADLEQALGDTFDPWKDDDSDLIYSVLRPQHPVDVSSKHLELHHKSRNAEELVALLNHSPGFVEAMLHLGRRVRAVDAFTGQVQGGDAETAVRLEPAGVKLLLLRTR